MTHRERIQDDLASVSHRPKSLIIVADQGQLDFETTPSLTLDVQITDPSGLTDSNVVSIDLTDLNDTPTLNAISNLTIDEGRGPADRQLGWHLGGQRRIASAGGHGQQQQHRADSHTGGYLHLAQRHWIVELHARGFSNPDGSVRCDSARGID